VLHTGVPPEQFAFVAQPTVKLRVALDGLVTASTPAPEVAVATNAWGPSASAVPTVNDHAPAPLTAAVPMVVAPSFTVTVVFAGPVPLTTGVADTIVAPSAGTTITGAARLQTLALQVADAGQSAVIRHRTHV